MQSPVPVLWSIQCVHVGALLHRHYLPKQLPKKECSEIKLPSAKKQICRYILRMFRITILVKYENAILPVSAEKFFGHGVQKLKSPRNANKIYLSDWSKLKNFLCHQFGLFRLRLLIHGHK